MQKLTKMGRLFYALAMAGVGFGQFYYGDFHPMIFPPRHAWIRGISFWTDLTGAALIVVAAAIVFEKKARHVSLILGGILLIVSVFYIPYMLTAHPYVYYKHLGLWGDAEKELALSGGAFLIASSFPPELSTVSNRFSLIRFLEKLIPLGGIFFSITMISFGIDHLLYTAGISVLVPSWIPGPIFWTYFAAVALIASGVAIILKVWIRPAAMLLGIMIFIWFLIIHIPDAVQNPLLEKGNEVISALSALAFSGIAFVIAGVNSNKKTQPHHQLEKNLQY
jgi:uncharacterized membrane protein YphA (DoxX/SURF4 family)